MLIYYGKRSRIDIIPQGSRDQTSTMADRCAGCTNKFKFREKPAICAKCGRNFCTLCIPKSKHKKKTPAVRETCIYCTRRLQQAMKEQEAVVLETFPDRFYNSPHVQPQLHTKLRLSNEQPGAGSGSHPGPVLSEEDRKLEERLRKLKESHKPTAPVNTEAVLKERLAKLRGDEHGNQGPLSSTGLPQPTNKTQAEQATDLVDQVSDRVKLDALTDPNSHPVEDSISKLLSGMEVKIEDEDPDKLLEDFKTFQAKQEQLALADATSKDVQALVLKARELHEQELNESAPSVTPYPQLPDTVTEESEKISQKEISIFLEAVQREIQQDEKNQRDIDEFVSQASKQLAELRGKDTSETMSNSEVHSKMDQLPPKLDFSWGHFGGQVVGGANLDQSTEEETAARQLGITLSNEIILEDGRGGDCEDDEVVDLIKKTMAEAALDRKLEEKGLDCYIKPDQSQPSTSKGNQKGNAAETSSSSGACAATHYPSSSSASAIASGSRWEMDPDDLPWCCICNADAHIRCYDCDNDLYCTQCFSEGHEQFGLFDHKYAPFEPLTNRPV